MGFEFTAENLSKPWFRLIVGIILVLAGIFCLTNIDMYSGITRESCTEVEVTLYEMRVDISDGRTENQDIRLIFDDYDINLDIHSSCMTDKLMSDMLTLEKGSKMTILHSDKNSSIYELRVNGEVWLDFETAREKIDRNITFVKYAGYVMIPVGVVFIISVAVTAIIKKGKSKAEYTDNE